jgi:hypothetical protein
MFDQPAQVEALMREFDRAWFIAGGWAIDLFLGRQTRAHADIEIAIFRRDQLALQDYLRAWNLRVAHDGRLSEWMPGDYLELPVHGIHCFNEGGELPFLEVLLNERDDDSWQFRRNRRITKPLTELYLTDGVRFLCPEVVLLYKSKDPRPKDEEDFRATIEKLSTESKKWLRDALLRCYTKHHWLPHLS